MKKIKFLIKYFFFQLPRIYKYKFLSNLKPIGKPSLAQPALLHGKGKIIFNGKVILGNPNSPYFYNTYSYFEARDIFSIVEIDSGTAINNNASIISYGAGIYIGKNCRIGQNFQAMDSNFHDLHPEKRNSTDPNPQKIVIEDNVFIGSNVTILKGVTIGKNSVIGSGSIVNKSIPENSIAAGFPAKVIKEINITDLES